MYPIIKDIHHYVGMATLVFIFLLTVIAFIYYIQGRVISGQVRKVSTLALILTHIQVLIGIVLLITYFSTSQVSFDMKNAFLRRNYMEHPLTMIIVAILITIVNTKIKKVTDMKFWMVLVLAISLALVIGMIPRAFWNTLFI